MNLVLLGPPGVGKGTHADDVSMRYKIPKISTGDIFREEMKKQSKLGKEVSKYMETGRLVPDDIVIDVLENRINQRDCSNGYILDGFPRTIPQAEALEEITEVELVVNFVAKPKTIIDRITNRWTCKDCSAIYNSLFIKPKKEGICDKCGGELYQREDQKLEVVEHRLKVYEEETKPLIDYYKRKGLLKDLNAEGEKEIVSQRLFKLLDNYFKK